MFYQSDDLVKVLPPPISPVENGGNWATVEQELGVSLPVDYKWFIETYGSGHICDYLYVFNVFSKDRQMSLQSQMKSVLLNYQNKSTINPHPVFPEPGGILQWGYSDNGHEMFWLTKGPPDTWDVVFHDRGRIESRLYKDTCLTKFLVDLLAGRMDGGKFTIPDVFLQSRPWFVPG